MTDTPIGDAVAAELWPPAGTTREELDQIEAESRDVDPDGDPDANDPAEINEAPADVDPDPILNVDHRDALGDVEEGEDTDEDLDGDEPDEPVAVSDGA